MAKTNDEINAYYVEGLKAQRNNAFDRIAELETLLFKVTSEKDDALKELEASRQPANPPTPAPDSNGKDQ